MNKLADELLKEILAPPLLVADQMFADQGSTSPFSRVTHSASDVLLVCKRWMRVATPALYHTVVIRTEAQAYALNIALTRNSSFGRFVRRIRLEGAYGQYLTPPIVNTMPHVQHLCFTLGVYADDKLGLAAAFKVWPLQHITLTLCQPRRARNLTHKKLVQQLCTAIEASTTLTSFAFSADRWYNELSSHDDICTALTRCTALERVSGRQDTYYNTHTRLSGGLKALLMSPKITVTIFCTQIPTFLSMDHNSDLMARIQHVRVQQQNQDVAHPVTVAEYAPPANAFWYPMENSPTDVRAKIWTRIMEFALYQPSTVKRSFWSHGYNNSIFCDEHCDLKLASQCLMLSNELSRAVRRIIARDIVLRARDRVQQYVTLRNKVSNVFIHRLDISLPYYSYENIEDTLQELLADETSIKYLTISLTLHSTNLFGWLRTTAGSVLHLTLGGRITFGGSDKVEVKTMFDGFDRLKELTWNLAELRLSAGTKRELLLPRLERLTVSVCHSTFWSSLAKCSLPKINHVTVNFGMRKAQPFFESHGDKIIHLSATNGMRQSDLDLLTNLTYLHLQTSIRPSIIESFRHPKLQTLQFGWMSSTVRLSRKQKEAFQCLLRGQQQSPKRAFAMLREVIVKEHNGRMIWPTSERDVRKSDWPDMATRMAEIGVTVLDAAGTTYRERMTLEAVSAGRPLTTGVKCKRKVPPNIVVSVLAAEDAGEDGGGPAQQDDGGADLDGNDEDEEDEFIQEADSDDSYFRG
ncbi:hypothetical protein BKA62DRAFT_698763 [Auriculariales sp. MPI-PUGE-AT-0066]|nr:hypothetical protein BKA62DRAFT_698763 [Auriculariales sp. MPI-PUGE-AT-0066]